MREARSTYVRSGRRSRGAPARPAHCQTRSVRPLRQRTTMTAHTPAAHLDMARRTNNCGRRGLKSKCAKQHLGQPSSKKCMPSVPVVDSIPEEHFHENPLSGCLCALRVSTDHSYNEPVTDTTSARATLRRGALWGRRSLIDAKPKSRAAPIGMTRIALIGKRWGG